MEEQKKQKKSGWSWKLDEAELKNQVENYNALGITKSYRGISVLILAALLALSLILSFSGIYSDPTTILIGSLIYLPFLFFAYKGHRWAIVLLMILWTYEKGYSAYEASQAGGSAIGSIIWWLIVMPYLWKALQVENERQKSFSKKKANDVFCHKCGNGLEADSKFCTKCGTKLISTTTS